MIFSWFPCNEYVICIYPKWTMLRIHLSSKVMVCIPTCVMPNHIFIPCHLSVLLHLNLSKIKARSCKIWFGQSSYHSHWLYICFIKTQNKHIPFMTMHYNMEWWWGTVTSMPNVMVVHIKFLSNLSFSQKTSLRSLYIDACLWSKSMPQSKEGILVKICQGITNTCPILYSTLVTTPTWSINIRYPQTLPILYEAWYAF